MRHSTKLSLLVPFLLFLLLPSTALAETTGPQWTVSAVSRPTNLRPGGDSGGDAFVVLVTNTGSTVAGCTTAQYESESGRGRSPICPSTSPVVNPVTITDELPEGLSPAPGATGEDELLVQGAGTTGGNFSRNCTVDGEEQKVSCTYDGVVQSGDTLMLTFPVTVASAGELTKLREEREARGLAPTTCPAPAPAVGCVTNVVSVSGGGALSAAMETPTVISEQGASFGVSPGGATSSLSTAQAGAHPNLTASVAFNTENRGGETAGNFKNTTYDLPAGFAGDLVDTPACQAGQFLREECPVATQVGIATVILNFAGAPSVNLEPVYDLAPEPGEVGKLGFVVKSFLYEGDISVRAPGEGGEPYGLRTTFYNITAGFPETDNVSLTVWGVPASASHDPLRWNPGELANGTRDNDHFGVSADATEAPFFTNPTSCGATPLRAALKATSWQQPEEAEHPQATSMSFGPIVGCDRLGMAPVLKAEVTSDAAYSASGFDLDTEIPQTYPNPILATSTLEQETVTLPEGMTVNPSSGAGLSACSEAQFAEEQAPPPTAQAKAEGHGCPNSSKLATVKIKTPSISEEVTGSAYLAEPAPRSEAGKNPFNSLLALYLIARAGDRGVLVKAPGLVSLNQETGRITTTFGPTPEFDEGHVAASPGLPPLPASDIKFEFNQGANAPLVTPPTCGDYTVTAELTPWSTLQAATLPGGGEAFSEGNPLDPSIPPFAIFANCPSGNVPPFNPGVTAYPLHGNAGAYSPLYLKISRQDGEQEITGFSTAFPPGLTGNLSGVAQCSEAQVQQARGQTGVEAETTPACPAGSEIGYSIAEAGVGGVLAQNPGKIYLGGPFDGAPFSVVSVTAAHVGPFDLGTVVIHFPLDINPETADVTIPASPADAIPRIIKGIVVHVRNIRVYVNRNDFMLNPTSCNPSTLSATVHGDGPSGQQRDGQRPVPGRGLREPRVRAQVLRLDGE